MTNGVFVYGGCVSRDAFTALGSTAHLSGYVARQSLISAFSPPAKRLNAGSLPSAFQNRMLYGDIHSNLVEKLEECVSTTDIVVVDLLVERLGVSRIRGGSFVTMSSELKQSRALDAVKDQTRRIKFGTDEHFNLWLDAAERFAGVLEANNLKSKTLVLETPWAERTESGQELGGNASMTPGEANRKYRRYYDALSSTFGFDLYRIPDEHALSSDDHRWGAAPYHYIQPAYHGIVRRILELLKA